MFAGSLCALVTPFSDDDAIDLATLGRLLDWHVASGTRAIVLAGSTGESAALDDAELMTLWRWSAAHVAGRVALIAGTGTPNTARSVRLTRLALDCGMQAALVVAPAYVRPTQAGMLAHYRAIAEVGLPLLLYNVPARTACDLLPATVEQLLPLSAIVGIKEALPDMGRIAALLALKQQRPDFCVLSGDDGTALDAMSMGADGVISVVANALPAAFATICQRATGSDLLGARAQFEQMQPLIQALSTLPNPTAIKGLLHAAGKVGGGIRLPLLPLDDAQAAQLQRIWQACADSDMRDAA